MASKKNKKVVRYRRPWKINIGVICFLILFVYLIFCATSYLGRKEVRYYEVAAGEMVNDTTHTGLILRTEDVQNAPASGYVNYYIRDGKRAAVGTRIYSLDETGNLKKYLEDNADQSAALSSQNLKELKTRLVSFSAGYSRSSFYSVYTGRDSIRSALSEYTSLGTLSSLESSLAEQGISYTSVTSPESGVVSFNIDSYEGKTADQVTAEDFNPENYSVSYTRAGDRAEKGTPVYKIVPSEDWQLVFPLTEQDQTDYADRKSLRVTFEGEDLSLTGDFGMQAGADGNSYGVLTFHQFMVRFIDDRFLNFQIASSDTDGLKIPASAITTKTFYTVPSDYLTNGGNSIDTGFLKETYDQGSAAPVFVPAEVFYEKDGKSYLDASGDAAIKAGDYLIKPDTNPEERFQVGETAELEGVYNINKGYAVFKKIDIIDRNDEYVTVKRGTSYGLNVYDHILLNGSEGQEGKPIYQ